VGYCKSSLSARKLCRKWAEEIELGFRALLELARLLTRGKRHSEQLKGSVLLDVSKSPKTGSCG
jgi:hypothetical protein